MRGRFRAALLSWASLVLAPLAQAEGGPEAWRVVRAAPELLLRFEDRGESPPCGALRESPDPAAVECWSAHVDRTVHQDPSPLVAGRTLACVARWEVTAAGEGGCPQGVSRCVRPKARIYQSVPADLPVETNLEATHAAAVALARSYTEFQMLRRGQILNPHRPRISGLALSQGMLVLRQAHAIESVRSELRAGGCGTDHLDPYFELAAQVTSEVGGTDLPHILETYPPPGREWARRFHRVQLQVLERPGRSEKVLATGSWREDCEEALAAGSPRLGAFDADLHAWCGYGYARLDRLGEAREHWQAARRSASHPQASGYADEQLRATGGLAGIETAASTRREDGGGQ